MKNRKALLSLLVLGIAIIISCERIPLDYRSEYAGNWEFLVIRREFDMATDYSKIDTITYNGSIEYGENEDEIQISYTAINTITFSTNEDGEFADCPDQHCGGKFEGTDSIHFFYRWGGLGVGGSHIVNGNKE